MKSNLHAPPPLNTGLRTNKKAGEHVGRYVSPPKSQSHILVRLSNERQVRANMHDSG